VGVDRAINGFTASNTRYSCIPWPTSRKGWDDPPGVAFGQKNNLATHINTVHLKLREHACPYCHGFGTKGTLTTHIDAVHLKLREHACPYCPDVAFGYKNTLTKHVNHVHLKIPRRCPSFD
jgi:hypothetical protein